MILAFDYEVGDSLLRRNVAFPTEWLEKWTTIEIYQEEVESEFYCRASINGVVKFSLHNPEPIDHSKLVLSTGQATNIMYRNFRLRSTSENDFIRDYTF